MGKRTRQTAFTLIELMVVVALVAIFALVGIPGYRSMTTTNRMSTEINSLMGDMQYARSEAIMRGVNVSICASYVQNSPPTCDNPATGWNAGWIVTVVGGPVLRIHDAMTSSDSFSSSNTSTGNLNAVTFDRGGFSANAGTISLHDQADTVSRRQCLVVWMAGRVRLESGGVCP